MNYIKEYSNSINKHFKYLVDDYNFIKKEDRFINESISCTVSYQNKYRYINLTWGWHDVQFYFYVFKLDNNNIPLPYNDAGVGHFDIFELACYHEPDKDWCKILDIGSVNPSIAVLNKKIKFNSEILYKYGKEILLGREWHDSKELRKINKKYVQQAGGANS